MKFQTSAHGIYKMILRLDTFGTEFVESFLQRQFAIYKWLLFQSSNNLIHYV